MPHLSADALTQDADGMVLLAAALADPQGEAKTDATAAGSTDEPATDIAA